MQGDPRYSQARQLHQSMMNRGPPPPGAGYPGPPPPGAAGGPPGSNQQFQSAQMMQLRAQIMAYRILARSQALPPQVAMAAQGKRPEGAQGGPPPPVTTAAAATAPVPPQGAGYPPRGPAPPNAQAPPSQPIPPMARPQAPPTGAAAQQLGPAAGGKPNRITPVPKPAGIDPVTVLQERENRLASRVAHRIDELSNLPVNMADDIR